MNKLDKMLVDIRLEQAKINSVMHIFKRQQVQSLRKLHLTQKISIAVVPEDSIKMVHV